MNTGIKEPMRHYLDIVSGASGGSLLPSSELMPAHGPNAHFKAYRFKQHLTFDELIFVIISHGHFASGERRTESFAS